jgi:hypothetical protein
MGTKIMNERIKELASQSRALAVARSAEGDDICTVGSDYFLKIEREEFANLIVKECVNLCKPEPETAYEELDEHAKGCIDGQDWCAETIKEHFGVKE